MRRKCKHCGRDIGPESLDMTCWTCIGKNMPVEYNQKTRLTSPSRFKRTPERPDYRNKTPGPSIEETRTTFSGSKTPKSIKSSSSASSYDISGGEHFKPAGEGVYSSNGSVVDVVSSPSGEVELSVSSSDVDVRLCDTCKKELPISLFLKSRLEADGYRKTCKNCSKKINAARGLEKILKWVSPGEEFQLDELKSRIDEPPELFENYIWVLQELDLIEYNDKKKTFQVVLNDKLEGFCGEFNISLKSEGNKKGLKTCENCKKELPLNNFMRSSLQADGYQKICRRCSKNKKAVTGLKELLKYVDRDKDFDREYLKKNSKGPVNILENYIWVLQELDLIKYNEKKKTYQIETNDKLNQFSREHGLKLDEIIPVKRGGIDKKPGRVKSAPVVSSNNVYSTRPVPEKRANIKSGAGKRCEFCHKKLDKDSFYKSRSEKDGLSRKCKECTKKDQAFNGIKQILKFTGPDKPFKKEAFIIKQKLINKSRGTALGYLRVCEDSGLLEEIDENTCIIKNTAELEKFLELYGASDLLKPRNARKERSPGKTSPSFKSKTKTSPSFKSKTKTSTSFKTKTKTSTSFKTKTKTSPSYKTKTKTSPEVEKPQPPKKITATTGAADTETTSNNDTESVCVCICLIGIFLFILSILFN